jgi:methionine-rich copper-binding protein CopC
LKRATIGWIPLIAGLLGAWTLFHIELEDSFPKADQALDTAPTEIWLKFTTEPDTAESTFSVRGPEGAVALGAIMVDPEKDSSVLHAAVEGAVPAGSYTVSWVAAPLGDHAVRGRFNFTVSGNR